MRSPFRQTPNMRYERMLISTLAASASFFVASYFFHNCAEHWRYSTTLTALTLNRLSLSQLTLGAGAFFIGAYFACAVIIQTYVPSMAGHRRKYVYVQRAAKASLMLACASALAYAALQVAFELST